MTPDGTAFVAHAADGLKVAAYRVLAEPAPRESRDLHATRPPLLLAHATGFCAGVWRPVRALLDDFESTALDFRGHGASRSHRTVRSWWEMAMDVLAVADHVAPGSPWIGVGHSMGGAALVMAEMLRPGTFAAMVLVEPIMLPGPYRRNPDHPLVAAALRRRESFESRPALRRSYESKPPFSTWHQDALAGYVDGGFVDVGGRVVIACSPRAEAEVFTAAAAHAARERLSQVSTPVRILYGADTDTYPPGYAEELATRFPDAQVTSVGGTGHFLPMERPDVVASAVRSVEDRLN